jgi:hypothetical protein
MTAPFIIETAHSRRFLLVGVCVLCLVLDSVWSWVLYRHQTNDSATRSMSHCCHDMGCCFQVK